MFFLNKQQAHILANTVKRISFSIFVQNIVIPLARNNKGIGKLQENPFKLFVRKFIGLSVLSEQYIWCLNFKHSHGYYSQQAGISSAETTTRIPRWIYMPGKGDLPLRKPIIIGSFFSNLASRVLIFLFLKNRQYYMNLASITISDTCKGGLSTQITPTFWGDWHELQ